LVAGRMHLRKDLKSKTLGQNLTRARLEWGDRVSSRFRPSG
jgi:hypothetical protein